MYRLLLTILLCLKAASSAPQTKQSDVTYVKIQPLVEDAPAEAATSIRESRIEKLPLVIPGNVSSTDNKEPDKKVSESNQPDTFSEEKPDKLSKIRSDDLSENRSNLSGNRSQDFTEHLEVLETNQSDQLLITSGTEESSIDTTDDLSQVTPTDVLTESDSENLSDTVPSETNQSDRRARNFDTETTETAEAATENYEDEVIDRTVKEAPRTRAPPKFVAKGPKLSYFQKPRVFQSYSSNLVEHAGKRRFRSRCSCQKIWNCPKLQITVPRCPNEFFLCCF